MLTVPNLLTLVRLALTPLVAALAYSTTATGRIWALGLFLFAMLTDVVDGWIARLPGQRSHGFTACRTRPLTPIPYTIRMAAPTLGRMPP